uniref:Lysozyme n=1 Tax=Amphimedon queenslandica TaxID=400682 RepID=A0A1X7THP7_AMPQE
MLKKLILIFVLVAGSYAGTCNSYQTELNEGYKRRVYIDTESNPTVGIGFNLNKPGAKAKIERVGANYEAVLNGSQRLSDGQIRKLFSDDMKEAHRCAKNWLRPSWNALGSDAQSAIADMAFMGCAKLHGFVKLHAALTKSPPDYEAAKNEMRNSRWCGQVGLRCDHDVACMHD